MQQYKYWLYYIMNDITNSYTLYAYTNDKMIADLFEEQRDMSKFQKKTKKFDKKDVHDMAVYYQCMILELMQIEFYDKDSNERYSVTYALTTTEKLNFIHMTSNVSLTIYKNVWTNPLIFNKEIQKALFDLDYYKYFINIADTLTVNAKHNLNHKIIDNIRQICEDGGFNPAQQDDSYFNTYIEMVHNRLPDLDDDLKIDQLAILVRCIKDTL